jgi:hypothetical protein
VPAALLCSLLANGFLVADLVTRNGEEAAQVAVRMVTLTANAVTTVESNSTPSTTEPPTTRVPATKATMKAAVERVADPLSADAQAAARLRRSGDRLGEEQRSGRLHEEEETLIPLRGSTCV